VGRDAAAGEVSRRSHQEPFPSRPVHARHEAEVLMVADPLVLTHDDSELDERAFAHAARRAKALPASRARMAAGLVPSPGAADPALLAYAASVLDREGEYCQKGLPAPPGPPPRAERPWLSLRSRTARVAEGASTLPELRPLPPVRVHSLSAEETGAAVAGGG